MERRKLESAALFLTVAGALLIMPPIAAVFQIEHRLFGIPSEVIYLFLTWTFLIVAAWWLGKRLPQDPDVKPQDTRPQEDEG
jgi:putative Ca2+/H+ antiporter (TMEM165/GDT1 family)